MAFDPIQAAEDRLARNRVPLVDEQGFITGFYDQRLGAPSGQPSRPRLTAHLAFLEQRDPGKFEIEVGQQIPGFDPVDPFESESAFDSFLNIIAAGRQQSLGGALERSLGTIGIGDEQADLYGLLTGRVQRLSGFRPNKFEKVAISIASFFQPEDLATLFLGGGLGAIGAKALGKTVIGKAGGKILAKTVTGAVNLSTYEGARGFFEGYLDPDASAPEQALRGAASGAVLGASFGLVGGVVGRAFAGVAPSRLATAGRIGTEAGAEILTLGTISPFLEGREPTIEDYEHAAGFIIGMKVAFAPLSIRGFLREKSLKAKELERRVEEGENADIVFNREVDAGAKKIFTNKIVNDIRRGTEGEIVGTIGEAIRGKRLKSIIEDAGIQDTPIRVTREPIEGPDGKPASGFFDPVKNEYVVNADLVDFIRPTLVHETAHALRNALGRKLANEVAGDIPRLGRAAGAPGLRAPTDVGVVARAEAAAIRGERAVAAGKPLAQITGRKRAQQQAKKRAEKRIVEDQAAIAEVEKQFTKAKKRPESFDVTRRVNKATGETERVVTGTFEVDGKGKKKKVQNVFRVPESAEGQRQLIIKAAEKASDKNQSLFLSKSLSGNTALVKNLQAAGLIGIEKVNGAFKVKKLPKGVTPSVALIGRRLGLPTKGKTPKQQSLFRTISVKRIAQGGERVFDKGGVRSILATLRAGFPKGAFQLKNRVTEVEAKGGMDMLLKADNIHRRKLGKAIVELEDLGFNQMADKPFMSKAKKAENLKRAEQLSTDVEAGRAPEISNIFKRLEKEIQVWLPKFGLKIRPNGPKNYLTNLMKQDLRDVARDEIGKMQASITDIIEGRNRELTAPEWTALFNKLSPNSKELVTHILNKKNIDGPAVPAHIASDVTRERRFLLGEFFDQLKQDLSGAHQPRFFKARIFSWPERFYERDIRKIMPAYLNPVTRWLAEQEGMGANKKDLNKLLAQLILKNPAEHKLVKEAVATWDNTININNPLPESIRKLFDNFTALQVATKIAMGQATILNLFQPFISIIPDLGIWNTLRAGYRLADPATRVEAGRLVKLSGAINRQVIEAVTGVEISGSGFLQKFANRATAISGFQGINKGLLFLAATTADIAMTKWAVQAKGSGFSAELAKKRLADFGIDWRKPITENQRLEAMQRFATDSQLQKNILNEPRIFNDQNFRPLFLFKRFGFRQAVYMKDMLIRETKRGNVMPAVRLAVGGIAGGAAANWGINTIKSALSGETEFDNEDSLFAQALNNFATVGAFGVMSDVLNIGTLSELPSALRFVIAPVALSDVERIADASTRFFGDWRNYGDGWLATRRNLYKVVGLAGSFPGRVAKRFRTEAQQAGALRLKKSQTLRRIFEANLDGDHVAMARLQQTFNDNVPREFKIEMQEVTINALNKWITRRARAFADQKAKPKTVEWRKAFRDRQQELIERKRSNQ